MKTRSLVQLQHRLTESWRNQETVELRRLGVNLFELGEPGVARSSRDGTFVFDRGFIDSDSPYEYSESPGRAQKAVRNPWIYLGLGVSLVALALAGFVAIGLRPSKLPAGNSTSQLKTGTTAAMPRDRVNSADGGQSKPITTCKLSLNSLQPMTSESIAYGTGVLKLVRSVVIGGEQEQQLTLTCGQSTAAYLVRFSLLAGTWKAKSATPMGSHS